MNSILNISSHWIALLVAIFLTAVSQVLLRAGAKKKSVSLAKTLLEPKILLGYLLFMVVVILMIYAMQEITLRTASALNSISYVLVPLMAHQFVKDPLDSRIFFGSVIIFIGIVVFLI